MQTLHVQDKLLSIILVSASAVITGAAVKHLCVLLAQFGRARRAHAMCNERFDDVLRQGLFLPLQTCTFNVAHLDPYAVQAHCQLRRAARRLNKGAMLITTRKG